MAERALRRLLRTMAVFPLAAGTLACAQPTQPAQPAMPRPDGPIGDYAAVLPSGPEAALDAKLRGFFAANCIALIVATTPSLKGQPIAQYANELARSWNIGDRHTAQGILLLVAPNDRKLRIEISSAVNRVITDEIASEIIRGTITPLYRKGDLAGGTIVGVDALISRLDAGRGTDSLDRTSCHEPKGTAG